MDNNIMSRDFHMMLSDTDVFRRLRLSVLFRMFQDISVLHSESLGAGRELTLDRGYLWIISKVRLECQRLPEYGEDITLKTWTGKMSHVLFPRYYQLEGKTGESLIRASSLWALIESEKRTPVIPKENGIFLKDMSIGGELPLPTAVRCPQVSFYSKRTVLYSETDMNGHMNNSKYLDWADDCLGFDFHRTKTLKKLQINFLAEAVQGTNVLLERSLTDGDYYLKGRIENTGSSRFSASNCPETDERQSRRNENESGKNIFALHALYI